jgi:hypothetical protein
VIFSIFRRTRTVPHHTVLHSISSYQTQTAPNYFYNKTRVRRIKSNHRTTVNNLLFLKTRVFLKKKHKISQNTHYFMVFFTSNVPNESLIKSLSLIRYGTSSTKVRENHCITR